MNFNFDACIMVCDLCRKRYAFLSKKQWFLKIGHPNYRSHELCDFCKKIPSDIDLRWIIDPSDLRSLKLNILAIKLKGIDL